MSQTPPSRPSLGDFIRERRVRSQLSLRDLSTMSKVSNAYISQIERGLHQPSVRVLRAIADALEALLGADDDLRRPHHRRGGAP